MSDREGMSMCRRCGTWVPSWSACVCVVTSPDKPDRYEEGRAAGIAEGRAQAFREAAEVARDRADRIDRELGRVTLRTLALRKAADAIEAKEK